MINVEKLEKAIGQKIKNSLSNYELFIYTKSIELLKTGAVYTVNTNGSLPLASSNEGKLYFVEDMEELFWSNGVNWLRLLNKQTADVQLFSWGSNAPGKFGDGTTISKCSPVREISSSTNWCFLDSGYSGSIGIKRDGTLWSWGWNLVGQLGDGTTVNKCSPVREASSSTNWCTASIGYGVSSAIKTDGSLWTWGSNTSGRLGDGTTVNKCSPVREISSSTNWCIVSTYNSSLAIKTDGSLWSWGINNYGQLGDGTLTNRCSPVREISSSTNWKTVSTSKYRSGAIKTNGSLWTWGPNSYGTLADGTNVSRCSPVREISSSTDWDKLSTGSYHFLALKNNGSLWSWGFNYTGELGNGSTVLTCSPIREICSATNWSGIDTAVISSSAATKTDGTIWTWGCGLNGVLGNGTTPSRCSPTQEITSSTNWCSISGGSNFFAALKVV